ncbi:hypothetical protein GCK32_013745 [Trichostrongylus colubriformis]|uniref:Uncharacterized protein n=1 Tax=Trichostrongylus colubriformis TaxID=6319 RepID=A0AAN8ITU8_TRICO
MATKKTTKRGKQSRRKKAAYDEPQTRDITLIVVVLMVIGIFILFIAFYLMRSRKRPGGRIVHRVNASRLRSSTTSSTTSGKHRLSSHTRSGITTGTRSAAKHGGKGKKKRNAKSPQYYDLAAVRKGRH